jgi:hypothetical protein
MRAGDTAVKIAHDTVYCLMPWTQRNAISAFTRVFEALWHWRSGALQSRSRNGHRPWYGPGSAKQRQERCIAPGTRHYFFPPDMSPPDITPLVICRMCSPALVNWLRKNSD